EQRGRGLGAVEVGAVLLTHQAARVVEGVGEDAAAAGGGDLRLHRPQQAIEQLVRGGVVAVGADAVGDRGRGRVVVEVIFEGRGRFVSVVAGAVGRPAGRQTAERVVGHFGDIPVGVDRLDRLAAQGFEDLRGDVVQRVGGGDLGDRAAGGGSVLGGGDVAVDVGGGQAPPVVVDGDRAGHQVLGRAVDIVLQGLGPSDVTGGRRGAERGGPVVVDALVGDDVVGVGRLLVAGDGQVLGAHRQREEPLGGVARVGDLGALFVAGHGGVAGGLGLVGHAPRVVLRLGGDSAPRAVGEQGGRLDGARAGVPGVDGAPVAVPGGGGGRAPRRVGGLGDHLAVEDGGLGAGASGELVVVGDAVNLDVGGGAVGQFLTVQAAEVGRLGDEELVRAVAFDGADLPVSAVLRPGLVLGVGQAVVVGEMPRGVADVLVPGGDRRRVADRVDLGDLLDEVLVVPVVFGDAAVVIGEGGDHRHAPHVV